MKSKFVLDPEVIFLNHGSFGACPRPVMDAYQTWQLALERQPVRFLGTGRDVHAHLRRARSALGAYIGSDPEDVVFFSNPTTAGNMVARSLALSPGDQILSSDHEYGALERTWRFVCRKAGAVFVQHPVPLPQPSPKDFLESLWQGVNEHTRVIFLSHITSPTAQRFPVELVCERARRQGILTVIDGAHAPGQLAIDMEAIGADIYIGACHKWMMAPKGSAFLYARKEVQPLMEPLVVSWGFEEATYDSGSPFVNAHEWQGTRDIAAFLAVEAAIAFQAENDWPQVQRACHDLLRVALDRIAEMTGLPGIYPSGPGHFFQMAVAELPHLADLPGMKDSLYRDYGIEVPLVEWGGRHFIRISVQGYNMPEEIEKILNALKTLLPRFRVFS